MAQAYSNDLRAKFLQAYAKQQEGLKRLAERFVFLDESGVNTDRTLRYGRAGVSVFVRQHPVLIG